MSKYSDRESVLARHINHRVQVKDARSFRCLDCSHTILLDSNRAVLTPEDQPGHVVPLQVECPSHRGELLISCRCCASEAKAQPDDQVVIVVRHPQGDTARGVAACRAALADAARRRGSSALL